MKRMLVFSLLLLGACRSKEPPPPEKHWEPAPGDAAYVGTEQTVLRLGDRRSPIAAWGERFPREIETPTGKLVLADATGVLKTEDFANAWHVRYAAADLQSEVQLATCEYMNPAAAKESYDNVAKSLAGQPLDVPGADAAGHSPDVAYVLSGRYLFVFKRQGGVPKECVLAVYKACFTEPKGE
jgi:hypothetical protein